MLAAVSEHDCGADEISWIPAFPWEYGTDQRRPGLPTRSQCREFLRELQKAPHRAIFFSSPLAWVFGSGIICPETNAPQWVQRAGFGQPFIASAQR